MTSSRPHLRPFRSLLVANRGEIALRVMATARRMGLRTIAVFSEADRNAPHVLAADQSFCLGAPEPKHSYLNIERIIEACRATGAEAVHPGYGFLAENPAFAEAVTGAGLVFVGPGAEAMRLMGNKGGAKRLMADAAVPCLPGYQGDDQSDAKLIGEAARIGFPVMVKAASGGGGRGMRLVASAADLPQALASARSEADGAFGSGELIIEKAVEAPRHVEVQVFADGAGNTIHLGERDCSVQRRHQKLIEESPSPAINAGQRARMGAAAVAAAKAVQYVGAGTVEFLLDAKGAFYFMEMNTRLQVEHAVTEALTGLDLVEWQIRVAMGENLPLAQEQVAFSGHAIEVRLCAEDADLNFMPQTGSVTCWRPPSGVRVDHALRDGLTVSPHYDSMIAKLVAHGPDRKSAIDRLIAALDDTVLLGLIHNGGFLRDCLDHAEFRAGNATTAFIASHLGRTKPNGGEPVPEIELAAAALLVSGTSTGMSFGGWSNSDARYSVARFGSGTRTISARIIANTPSSAEVSLGIEGEAVSPVSLKVESIAFGPATLGFETEGAARLFHFSRQPSGLWLHVRGRTMFYENRLWHPAAGKEKRAGDGSIRAALTGKVAAVLVEAGATVRKGAVLAVLEAMKMEHPHLAPFDGIVTEINVSPGAQVDAGRILAKVEKQPS